MPDKNICRKRLSCSTLLKIVIPIALILVAAILFKFKDLPGSGKEPIRIGAILPLSGVGGYLVDLRDAMVMAAEEVNALGGVDDRKIELIIEDSKSSPVEAEKIFLRLEQEQQPLLYVSALSSVGMVLAPLAARRQVVLMGLVTSTPQFAEQGRWVFRNYTNSQEEARVAQRMLNTLKVRQLAILHADDPYGNSVAKLLGQSFATTGGSATDVAFAYDAADLTSQIETVRTMQAVYVVGLVGHIRLAIRQLRQAGYAGHLIAASEAANPQVTEMAEADGVYVGTPLVYNEDFLYARQFKDNYKARFGKPFSHQAANGYDCVKMIAGLLEGNEVSRRNVQFLLSQGFLYSGVQGDYELKAGSQEIMMPLYPARIDQGQLRLIQ
ncbi:MAG: ABC transporter substrate-binding protein [Proteobacteria bacterium]|nr:ABC transporter substrate-binding protein [Pseudomonadota bacterium]MBU4296047.1 ABC transporter substrate-binding protein [Pseudomonadota bacterium]MCG2747298.1 ABC transporter substrate-binding protein [Desulfobulbaceae bacterium]